MLISWKCPESVGEMCLLPRLVIEKEARERQTDRVRHEHNLQIY